MKPWRNRTNARVSKVSLFPFLNLDCIHFFKLIDGRSIHFFKERMRINAIFLDFYTVLHSFYEKK